jgi:methionyl-tRNA formyltransferase
MDILVFVSKTIGFECLKWLLSTYPHDNYTIFISDPDKTLIQQYLKEKNIHCYDVKLHDPVKITEGKHYDWLVNIWGSYIFRKNILSRVESSVNLHPSYLPYGRGRDPIVWAIRDNVPAGATLHVITEDIDQGDIWAQTRVDYTFPITGGDLYKKVEKACIDLFIAQWPSLYTNKLTPVPQGSPDLPTRKRTDLLNDRTLPQDIDLIRKIMAHDFKENGYTALLNHDNKTYTVTLTMTAAEEKND